MRIVILLAAAFVMIPLNADAQDSTVARSLAATCANCHGTDGRSVSPAVIPLAGVPKEVIVQRMSEFKEGKRPATVMHQLAKGYSDQQIELIAAHFSAQAR